RLHLAAFLAGFCFLTAAPVIAQQAGKGANNNKIAKGKKPPPQRATQVAPPAPKSALLTQKTWDNISRQPLQRREIDQLIAKELQGNKIEAAPLTNDEQFIRRVTLDLTGQLPVPAEVKDFANNSDTDKRAKLVDKLLASEEFAAHWAKYWRDVIAAPVTDRRCMLLARPFEAWLTREFQKKQRLHQIVPPT